MRDCVTGKQTTHDHVRNTQLLDITRAAAFFKRNCSKCMLYRRSNANDTGSIVKKSMHECQRSELNTSSHVDDRARITTLSNTLHGTLTRIQGEKVLVCVERLTGWYILAQFANITDVCWTGHDLSNAANASEQCDRYAKANRARRATK
ncbi:uncharacterized protein MONBRDRAFT_7022 [Monosiga brevicollis MX1]|uniref:Uncharacterized protein n=1 Tax=Monosiga brevicollis TaxID=81824 RepID=A9UVN9_MONBE|nr:uncharacterized protein MONBRDRAFT_7022 [Monosiga brevicollis MX1]EDQ90429.1 predicted protein [Monosiga brevicollis MX1]|eukprot:XP_001744480.1 hypothetical protein [Monosiga brevicollis MX1]